ncbi:phosphotransferase [Lentzea kentuckyensis]|uniref:phosphotransferase n=1 Tax=Lentzea kentuckyensis TaxID=360086 RepID=UPI000A3BC365|nr:phosphotransferase [Lentzea kentuckyensis]
MKERSIIALVSAPSGFAGRTDAIPVSSPFWNQVDEVNEKLEQLLGVPTSVLRLVSVENGRSPAGGLVTYHVEAHGEPDRTSLHDADEPEPDAEHRQEWARRGGPADLIAWADTQVVRTDPPVQMRTWNLSSVHRLPTEQGPVWLKAVPPFFADEGTLIKIVAAHDPALVPGLIASAPHRVLLRDEPGGSGWPLEPEYVEDIVPRWVAVQHALAGEPLVRPTPVPMPDFGLPDTLLHGDFHPGNWRANGKIIDWSDASWGHPALDLCRLLEVARPEHHELISRVWTEAWLRHRPESRPREALEVAKRAHLLHSAVKIQEFLDNIEEAERIYHLGGVEIELRTIRELQ